MDNWLDKEMSEFSQHEIDTLRQSASENLRSLREAIGVNQEAFAKVMGVSRAALSYYENNSRTPDIDFVNKVAIHTECSLDYLLGWCQTMSRNHVELAYLLDLEEEEIKRLFDLLEYDSFKAILHSERFEMILRILRYDAREIIVNGKTGRELVLWKCMKLFEQILDSMLAYEYDKLLEDPEIKRIVEERDVALRAYEQEIAKQREAEEKSLENELLQESEKMELRRADNPFALFRYKMVEESRNSNKALED